MTYQPLIGVSACFKAEGDHPRHIVVDKYVRAAAQAAGVLPLVIPALAELIDQPSLLSRLDGLLLTGSPSNIEPHHYQAPASTAAGEQDPLRDRTVLPLIRAAVDAGVPLLGICRGFQEMNVAYGGSLYARVHEVAGLLDHRENPEDELDTQYGPAHPVRVTPTGLLARAGLGAQVVVNSLHGQGIERLAPGLSIEAVAEDGLVEAFSVSAAPTFALGVQWHPEWKVMENPDYQKIFAAFGAACRARAALRDA